MDTADWVGIIFAVSFVIFIFSFVVNAVFYFPVIQNNAQNICVDADFETFIDYSIFPYSTSPRALYCGTYEQRMIKEGKIDAYQNTGDEKGTFVIKSSGG